MTKNKKNFFVGIISCGIMFLMGVLYLTVPSYYGLDYMVKYDVNDLFICMVLVYSVLNFAEYVILGKNPNNENIWLSIVASLSGILNILIGLALNHTTTLAISLAIFVFGTCAVRLFTIDYYHDRKDAYFYIEIMITSILLLIGVVICFNLFNDAVIQTIILGFFFIITSLIEASDVGLRTMLKSKRFLKKIKLK